MALSEAFGPRLDFDATNLFDLVEATVSKYPDKTALICSHQPANLYENVPYQNGIEQGDCLRWTYSQLHEKSMRLASNLYSHGVRKGMALATFIYNGAEWMLTMLAALRLGCVFVPLNPRVLVDSKTTAHMLRISDTKVVVVHNDELGRQLDSALAGSDVQIKLKIKVDTEDSTLKFADLVVNKASLEDQQRVLDIQHAGDDPLLICFTSGTTSLPKACLHLNQTMIHNLYAIFIWSDDHVKDKVISCNAMPNNHLIGIWNAMGQIINGGTTVHPGPAFATNEVLAAINKERVTDIVMVPTMVFAMIFEVRTGRVAKPTSLERVTMGGSAVTAELIKQCQDELGARTLRGGYGMSEGSPIRGPFVKDVMKLKRGHTVVCGSVVPGARFRICAPGSRVPLPIGQPGELHQGGNMMKGYIGRDRSEDWYTDEHGEWFLTGDQAIMEEDGQVIISGRYKEIIIRGGENLSPAVIEAVINKAGNVESVVVPAPDDIAGEVPIAVIKSTKNGYSVKALQAAVQETLGHMYVPDAILNLGQLGMGEDFPRTLSGKVQKIDIAARVREHRSVQVNGDRARSGPAILGIWSQLLGLREEELNLTIPVQNFADSIAVMRFIDAFRKQTGKALSVEDIIENPTIEDQIRLANAVSASTAGSAPPPATKSRAPRVGPPTASEMVHLSSQDPVEFNATKSAIESVLKPSGMTWEDVSTVTPAYDHAELLCKKRRLRSWVMRYVHLTEVSDPEYVRKALEGTLTRCPNMHSFFLQGEDHPKIGTTIYVTIQSSKRWFDHLITETAPVETEEDLENINLFESSYSHASFPGPLFHADLVRVKQTGKIGIVMSLNHATLDALSQQLFSEDLDALLANPNADVPYHDDYTLWSDANFLTRKSPQAEHAINYHVKRLSGLTKYKKSLFPVARAPEWFFGHPNADWSPKKTDLAKYENPLRKNLNKTITLERLDRLQLQNVHLPSLLDLRAKMPQLTGPAILKTALALFNVHHTGQRHALYGSLESNRSKLAFMPSSLASRLELNLADMPGAMYTRVVDLIEVVPDERVVDLLARVQEEQTLLTRYGTAPMREIHDRLDAVEPGAGAGDMFVDIVRRQFLNWVPGLGRMVARGVSPTTHYKMLKFSTLCDEGYAWAGGMGGADGSTMYLGTLTDDANIKTEEATLWVEQVLKITTWITDEQNWERRVGDVEQSVFA